MMSQSEYYILSLEKRIAELEETAKQWEARAEKAESECDKLREERDYYRKDNDRLIMHWLLNTAKVSVYAKLFQALPSCRKKTNACAIF